MNWLNNAWVVGIGTGVLSGLLVTWLLNLFISKKKDREYLQKISSANREITNSIRTGIPENNLPTREIVEALINSTARRYEVQPSELYQVKELSEELVKEVMDSSFLSPAKKIEYCAALLPLGKEYSEILPEDERSLELSIEEHRAKLQSQRRKIGELQLILTGLMGATAALVSGAAATRELFPSVEKKLSMLGGSVANGITSAAIILVSSAVFMTLIERFGRAYRQKSKDDPAPKDGK
jgi:hypothetical protein